MKAIGGVSGFIGMMSDFVEMTTADAAVASVPFSLRSITIVNEKAKHENLISLNILQVYDMSDLYILISEINLYFESIPLKIETKFTFDS